MVWMILTGTSSEMGQTRTCASITLTGFWRLFLGVQVWPGVTGSSRLPSPLAYCRLELKYSIVYTFTLICTLEVDNWVDCHKGRVIPLAHKSNSSGSKFIILRKFSPSTPSVVRGLTTATYMGMFPLSCRVSNAVPWVLRVAPSAPTNSKLWLGIRSGALVGECLRILSHASFQRRVTNARVQQKRRSTPLIRPESLYPETFTVLE